MAGLDACLKLGADIIVNTDADNQYNAKDIPLLIKPILEKKAELVIGARPISEIKHFPFIKKQLQKLGSWVVRLASKTDVPDAPSGFRAMSREAAMRLNVFNDYTYTLETIIQAGQKKMAVTSVPVRVNDELAAITLGKEHPFLYKKIRYDDCQDICSLQTVSLFHDHRSSLVCCGLCNRTSASSTIISGRAARGTSSR